MTERVFAYGSNTNLNDLEQWMKNKGLQPDVINGYLAALRTNGKCACLAGYRLVWNYVSPSRGGGAANVELAPQECVYGVVYEVDDELLKLFDRKEGHPTYYCRKQCQIQALDGEQLVVGWVYMATKTEPRLVPPTQEYKAIVMEGARFWGLPDRWLCFLESAPQGQNQSDAEES